MSSGTAHRPTPPQRDRTNATNPTDPQIARIDRQTTAVFRLEEGMSSVFCARLRRWRAVPGTPEWHRATAEIRAAGGDQFQAAVHRLAAAAQEFLIAIVESAAKAFESLAEVGEP